MAIQGNVIRMKLLQWMRENLSR